jgi:integrase
VELRPWGNTGVCTLTTFDPSAGSEALIRPKATGYGHRDVTVILLASRQGSGRPRFATSAETKSTLMARCSTSAGSKTAPRAHTIQGDALGAAAPPARESIISLRARQRAGFMIERAAAGAGLEPKAHPACSGMPATYALANKGHDTRAIQGWLGHRSITSRAVYTALAPNRFKDFWRE